jgi:hypothetical protein
VDRDGQAALGGGLEDREVARLAVRALGAADEQHVDEAHVAGQAADLGRRRERVLRGADDASTQASVRPEPALAQPVVVSARELRGAIGARHQRDGDRVVGVEDAGRDAEPVEDVAPHLLGARAGDAAGLVLEIVAEEGVRVDPRVPGQPERLRLDSEPVALGRVDVREHLLGIADLDVDVAVDHHPER